MWNVPVISQRSTALCWEASARMLWGWKHRTSAQSWATYKAKAGPFAELNTGLIEKQMDVFYKQLGIRSLESPQGKNIRHALKWTPVIITSVAQMQGHAMVVVGHSGAGYRIVNPCGVMEVDFESDEAVCGAATKLLSNAAVEGELGKFIWYW